jgi:hypothetical protein
MCMNKLVTELLTLLSELLAGQQRLLALARREAMRAFDSAHMEALAERERAEALAAPNQRRALLVGQFRILPGRNVAPTVSETARRVADPRRSQLPADTDFTEAAMRCRQLQTPYQAGLQAAQTARNLSHRILSMD